MALIAFNLTATPDLPLAAGNPAPPTLGAGAPPEPGPPLDVSSELQPSLTVDPINGVAGGLELGDYTALEAQRLTGDTNFKWDGPPLFETGDLTVGGEPLTADEKAALAGHGTPSALNPYVTRDTVRPQSLADRVMYVDKATGSDSNSGTSWGEAWENLEKALREWRKYDWRHHCWIQYKGAHSVPWDLAMFLKGDDQKFLVLDGGPDVTVVAAAVTANIGGASGLQIGNSGLTLTKNEHFGYDVLLGNIGGSPGPLTGEKRKVLWNDGTTYYFSNLYPFPSDPNGYDFEVVEPASTITCDLTDFTPEGIVYQNVYGQMWAVEGFVNVRIQRTKLNGQVPFNLVGDDGKPNLHLADCVIDKIQAFGNIWRSSQTYMQGGFGYLADVLDPADITGATVLAENKCGVGHVGGDASVFFIDLVCEGNRGIASYIGSAFEKFTPISCNQENQIGGTHIKNIGSGDIPGSSSGEIYESSVGGFEFAAAPGLKLDPGIWVNNSMFNLGNNVVARDCTHGIDVHRGFARFDGTGITDGGGILGFFAVATKGGRLWYDPAATVMGAGAKGEISLNGVTPVVGGHAGVLAGTRRFDPAQGSAAEVYAKYGSSS